MINKTLPTSFIVRSLTLAVVMFGMFYVSTSIVSADSHTIELDGDVNGMVTISAPGYYVDTDGESFKTVTIASDDVTLDGLMFDGEGTTGAAVRNSVAGLSNVAVLNSTFTGYTGRTITFGFAEGVSNAVERASNIEVSGNTIVQFGNSATAVAVFDTDGVTLADNDVSFADGTMSRRGFNLDGNTAVVVTGNVLAMNEDTPAPTVAQLTLDISPWAIQLSMSNAEIADISIKNNKMFGSYYGITVLSQRDASNISIVNNEVASYRGIVVNTGGVAPLSDTVSFSDIAVRGNKITAAEYGVMLRDLHTQGSALPGTKTILYTNVKVNGNKVTASLDSTEAVGVLGEAPEVIYSKVKVSGNPLK